MLTDIETFLMVIRAGSFAAAADRLEVSPALVGRRIQALEAHFGAKLIERTTRSHRLTEVGEQFLPRAEQLIDTFRTLEEETRGAQGRLSGRIRLSAPVTLGTHRLAPLVAGFRRDHPDVEIELNLTDRRVDLISEGYDLALRVGELPSSSLIAKRIGTYRFAVVAAPEWIARHGTPSHPTDLEQVQCILNLNMRPRNKWPFYGPSGRIEVAVGGGLEIDNGEAQHRIAREGAGIAYLPVEQVGTDLASGRLVRLLPDWKTMEMPAYLVYPTRRFLPVRLSVLIEAITHGIAPDTSNGKLTKKVGPETGPTRQS